jgi:hypothetical protein
LTARRELALWFGVFGAPLAWTLHLVVGLWFEEAACSTGSRAWGINGHVAQIALSAAAISLAALGLGAAFWTWRLALGGDIPDPRGRVLFLALSGMLAAMLFLALTLLTGAYVIILDPCTPG